MDIIRVSSLVFVLGLSRRSSGSATRRARTVPMWYNAIHGMTSYGIMQYTALIVGRTSRRTRTVGGVSRLWSCFWVDAQGTTGERKEGPGRQASLKLGVVHWFLRVVTQGSDNNTGHDMI